MCLLNQYFSLASETVSCMQGLESGSYKVTDTSHTSDPLTTVSGARRLSVQMLAKKIFACKGIQ